MEATRAEKTRLGVFLIVTAALFAVAVLFLAGSKLFSRTTEYYTRLEESVTGLEPGSVVKQNGVDVGEITDITADSVDIRKTVVRFRVKRGTHMKTDMSATLGSYGITGLKYLEITGGSYASPQVPEWGEVPSSLSVVGKLTVHADSIAYKVDHLLGNIISITETGNRDNLNKLVSSSASLAESLDSLTRDLQGVRPGRRIGGLLDGAEATLKDFQGKIHRSDVDGAVREYKQAAVDIQSVAKNLDVTVRRTQEDLSVSMANLKETLKNLNTFSRQIKENPSVLLRPENKQERQ